MLAGRCKTAAGRAALQGKQRFMWSNYRFRLKIERSIVIGSRGEKFDWNCTRFDQLTEAHFAMLAETQPELVIFGSGTRLRFAPPAFMRVLMQKRIGVETMDTLAACRTYNILAGEGRQVLAALLIEDWV